MDVCGTRTERTGGKISYTCTNYGYIQKVGHSLFEREKKGTPLPGVHIRDLFNTFAGSFAKTYIKYKYRYSSHRMHCQTFLPKLQFANYSQYASAHSTRTRMGLLRAYRK